MGNEDKVNIANLYSLYQCVADNWGDCKIFQYNGFKIIKTEASAWPNMVYDVATDAFTDDFVMNIKASMNAINAGPVVFEPESEWVDVYKRNGVFPADRWIGMVKTQLGKEGKSDEKKGVIVRTITENEFSDWSAIVSKELFGGKLLPGKLFLQLPTVNNEYIGLWLDGSLVGTSMIHYDEGGNAGIYMVCVLEQYRGMGLGKLLVEQCYECIKKKGINQCVLQATQKGVPLYTSMGFSAYGNYTLLMKIR